MDENLTPDMRLNALEQALERVTAQTAQLTAKESIRECVLRFSRGLDRMDRVILESVFHPDAYVDFGDIYTGPAGGFIDSTLRFQKRQFQVQHLVGGILVSLGDNTATAESYELARHRHVEDDATVELVLASRYLDEFTVYEGSWVISRRAKVLDTGRATEVSTNWIDNSPMMIGTRDLGDLSYRLAIG